MKSETFTEKPLLVVVAGPNGSGKSTITQNYEIPALYINADEIQKYQEKVVGESLEESTLRAAQEAERQRESAIENKCSFAMETVLSTPRNINLMHKAKEAGYEIALIYITTQDPDINLKRVLSRKKKGGHDVPPDKIISRYEKCSELLPDAFKIADKARIYNNSFKSPVLIIEKNLDRNIIIYPQKPPSKWSEQKIKELAGIENIPGVKTIYPKSMQLGR